MRNNIIKLPPRLRAIAALVRPGAAVIDVGCDHGLIPVWLLQNRITENVTAADINPAPLERARTAIQKAGVKARLLLTDGLDGIKQAGDIIIAGMGGELIANIINRADKNLMSDENLRLILQPMSKIEVLRRRLYEGNFIITSEHAVIEDDRAYLIIIAQKATEKIQADDVLIYGGLIARKTDPAARRYAFKVHERLSVIARSPSPKAGHYKNVLEELEKLPAYTNIKNNVQ